MNNMLTNMIIESGSVVFANSRPEALQFFLSDEIKCWEERHGGVKFTSLIGEEKNKVIWKLFCGGDIFEIKTSDIKRIN